ncbi:MAG: alpha/beta hydrolase [Candidatus Nanohaloarchaeota archaeon QJJ-5]|nr:alpha/beta hydrolase [Candidatus Nanohaloarchaeota archaeon QJJ-5]
MVTAGRFENGCRYVEIGSGDRNVLILPGYEDAILNTAGHPLLAKMMLRGFDTDNCTLRYVGRQPGVPDGYTTRDMAEDYATIIRPETHIIGISLGGMIAQHLADISDDVNTMTLCNSGPDDSDQAGEHLATNLEKARNGDWHGFRRGVMWDVDSWLEKQLAYLGVTVEQVMNDDYADDVINAGQAALDHDSWELLPDIEVPSFLITGRDDRSFPPSLLEEAVDMLPDAELAIVDADHEYFYNSTADFSSRWNRFVSNVS